MSTPLPSLFRKALQAASKAYDLPTIDDGAQELIQSSLADLKTLQSRISALSLFSPNETLDDISTKDLIHLLVPYVHAQIIERVTTTERNGRLAALTQAQSLLHSFLESLALYDIVSEQDHRLFKQKASVVTDPTKRRDLKIQQYKRGKELRYKVETIARRRNTAPLKSSPSEFDLILALLPSNTEPEDEDEDDTTTEASRDAILLLQRLAYTQTHTQLESIEQEKELLRAAPPLPTSLQPIADPGRNGNKDDDMWRLDARRPPIELHGKGPLLDASGRPLRPFTILPAGASERVRLRAEVFRPDHRLPTMSVDEYLQIEQERGNILAGGGAASAAAPTSSELLALDAEQDGTMFGEENEEKKRQKDEHWAVFTDTNVKGAGNTMNRG